MTAAAVGNLGWSESLTHRNVIAAQTGGVEMGERGQASEVRKLGSSVVELQQPADASVTLNIAVSGGGRLAFDQPVVESLVIALFVIVASVL